MIVTIVKRRLFDTFMICTAYLLWTVNQTACTPLFWQKHRRVQIKKSFISRYWNVFIFRIDTTDSVAKLRYQTIHLFREYKVKMLIINEFHSLLMGTPRLQRQIMNAIKMLCNELQIPIVSVGTKDAIRVLHTYPQHTSRFDVAELPIWKLNKDFQKLLFQFQGILPLKKCSNLQSPELATKINTISGGNLGNVYCLLNVCTVEAITSGTE